MNYPTLVITFVIFSSKMTILLKKKILKFLGIQPNYKVILDTFLAKMAVFENISHVYDLVFSGIFICYRDGSLESLN